MDLARDIRGSRGSPNDIRAVAFKIDNDRVTLVPRQEASDSATFERAQCEKSGADCYTYTKNDPTGSAGAKRFLDFFFSKEYDAIKKKIEDLKKLKLSLLENNEGKIAEVDDADVEERIYDSSVYPQADKTIIDGINAYNEELKAIRAAEQEFDLTVKLKNLRGLKFIPPLPRLREPLSEAKPPSKKPLDTSQTDAQTQQSEKSQFLHDGKSTAQPQPKPSSRDGSLSKKLTQQPSGVIGQKSPATQNQGLAPSSTQPSASTSTSTSALTSTSTSALTSASASQANSSNSSPYQTPRLEAIARTPPNKDFKTTGNLLGQGDKGNLLNRGSKFNNPRTFDIGKQQSPSRGEEASSPKNRLDRIREPWQPPTSRDRQSRVVPVAPASPRKIVEEPVVDKELEKINKDGNINNIYGFLQDYNHFYLDKTYFKEAKNINWDTNDIVIVEHNEKYVFGIVNKVDGSSLTVLVYEPSDKKVVKIVTNNTYLFNYTFDQDPGNIGDRILYDIYKRVTNKGGPLNYYNKKKKYEDLYNKKLLEPMQGGRKRTTRRHKIARRKTGKRR